MLRQGKIRAPSIIRWHPMLRWCIAFCVSAIYPKEEDPGYCSLKLSDILLFPFFRLKAGQRRCFCAYVYVPMSFRSFRSSFSVARRQHWVLSRLEKSLQAVVGICCPTPLVEEACASPSDEGGTSSTMYRMLTARDIHLRLVTYVRLPLQSDHSCGLAD